jgi:hypothetical protein
MQLKKNATKGVRFKDLTGMRFGKLVAVEPFKKSWCSKYFWKCECDCGKEISCLGSNLLRGNTSSCGCYKDEKIGDLRRSHGLPNTRIFKIWAGIRKRCNNPKCAAYKDYGGRGIKICERWDKFENFYEDMKDGYADNLSLDRFPNVNGDYEPGNCRWATTAEQNRNRRTNVIVEYNGVSKTLTEWQMVTGIRYSTISNRIKQGWSVEDALSIKTKKKEATMEEISMYLCF